MSTRKSPVQKALQSPVYVLDEATGKKVKRYLPYNTKKTVQTNGLPLTGDVSRSMKQEGIGFIAVGPPVKVDMTRRI